MPEAVTVPLELFMNECRRVMESNKLSLAGKAKVGKCIIKGYDPGWARAGELRNQCLLETVCPLGNDSVTRSHPWFVNLLTWVS